MGVEENNIRANWIRKIAFEDDQVAFRSLFDAYYHRLLNFAFYFLESSVAAEEVVSGVFINLWKNRKKLPEIHNIDGYLFSSTKNKSYNYLRDNRRFLNYKEIDAEDEFLVPVYENPESQLLSEELRQKLIEIVEGLPPRCKIIFTLVREDGLKYKEVADLLDISIKTVEVQMGRALFRIKNSIRPYLHEVDLFQFLSAEKIRTKR